MPIAARPISEIATPESKRRLSPEQSVPVGQLWTRWAGLPLRPIATVIVSVAVTPFEIW